MNIFRHPKEVKYKILDTSDIVHSNKLNLNMQSQVATTSKTKQSHITPEIKGAQHLNTSSTPNASQPPKTGQRVLDDVSRTPRQSRISNIFDESTRPFSTSEDATCSQNTSNCLVMLFWDLFLGAVVLYFEHRVHPPIVGYFCGDESIRYPKQSETISTTVLVWVVCFVPIFIILAVELFRVIIISTPKDSLRSISLNVFGRLMHVYGAYMFGVGFTQVCVETGKYTLGWLRPHFLDVCKPLVDHCNNAKPYTFITDYECTGDPDLIDNGRLSFPSGHAAHSFYTAIFLSMFGQYRLPRRKLRLPRHILQGILLLTAWFTAISRLYDHMHHIRDVAVGSVLGIITALLTINFVSDMKMITLKEESANLPFIIKRNIYV